MEGQQQGRSDGNRDQQPGGGGVKIKAKPPTFLRKVQEEKPVPEQTTRTADGQRQRTWTCNQPRSWRTPIRHASRKEEKKNQDGKKEEEAKELAEEEKEEILKEMEQQKEQEIVNSCEVSEIANGRISRPRKSEKLNNKELYDIIFKTNSGNQPKILPVLTITAKITHRGKENIACIIDTGSNLSFIHSSLIENSEINKDNLPKILSANSTPINILGTRELTLEVNNIVLRESFYVTPDINSQVILGNSFLIKNKAELNYKTKQIVLHLGSFSHSIPMQNKWYLRVENLRKIQKSGVNQITDIRLEEDLMLAPHQHRRIPINIESDKQINFEPEKLLKERKKCYGYLVEDHDKKFVNIYNASNFPRHIKQNTVIGFITEEGKEEVKIQGETPKISKIRDPRKKILADKDGVEFDISPNLTVDQHNQVYAVLDKFKHLFTTKIEDLSPANIPPVKLETVPNHKPVNLPPYRHGKAEREQLNKLIDELLKADILEECKDTTEYASPVFLVKNKDNSSRLIGDMRGVNKILKNAASAMPSVKLVLSCLNNACFFSKLDLKGAYHQLLVREEDRNLLTIKTQDRLLRYKRLTMGLKVSSTIFSKTMLTLLNKYLYHKCISYVDDIITWGTDFGKDLGNLEIVLEILSSANLKLNTKKCKFLYNEVNILGYNVSEHGIKPQASNVKSILEFKRPDCIRKVRMWCGATSFFRSTIKGYSDIVAPLTDLIKDSNKKIPFRWDDKCEKAFLKIKAILTEPPLLAHFKDDWPTEVYVDSSLIGLGGSLIQINPETNKPHPVAYVSKKYTDTQKRYSNAEREMLALTYTVSHFREQLLGREVTVYTDCAALVHYKNFKNTSSRLNRLAISLVDYDLMVIKYRPGSKNLLADSLSRNPIEEGINEEVLDVALNLTEIKTENFEYLQSTDPFLREIKLAKVNPDQVNKRIRRQARLYEERDGLLYYKQFNGRQTSYLLAVPQQKVNEILEIFHDDKYGGGHFSNFKTAQKIKTRYYWPTLTKDVFNYTKTCDSCQLKRSPTYKQFGKLIPQIPPITPMSRICLDFYGPISPSHQNKYILMVTDSTTRMLFATPCRSCDAKTVANKLIALFCTYGYPREIMHDAGTHFSAQLTKHFMQALGITDKQSPPNAQHIQGMTERQNAVIRKALSHYVEKEPHNWSEILKFVVFSINTSVNPSTGYTPFYLFFGHEAGLPSDYLYIPENMEYDIMKQIKYVNDIRKQIAEIMRPAQNKQKQYFDRNKRDLELKPGTEVLVKQTVDHTKPFSKFANLFKGPYIVKEKLNPVTYLITMPRYGKLSEQPIHVSNLKPYHRR